MSQANQGEIKPDLPIPEYLTYNDEGVDYGATLQAYREQFDISRRTLAEILDCTVGTVRRWEQGNTPPTDKYKRVITDRLYLPESDQKICEDNSESFEAEEPDLSKCRELYRLGTWVIAQVPNGLKPKLEDIKSSFETDVQEASHVVQALRFLFTQTHFDANETERAEDKLTETHTKIARQLGKHMLKAGIDIDLLDKDLVFGEMVRAEAQWQALFGKDIDFNPKFWSKLVLSLDPSHIDKLYEEFKDDVFTSPGEIKEAIAGSIDPLDKLRKRSRLCHSLLEEFKDDKYVTPYVVRRVVSKMKNPRTVLKAKSRLFHKLMEEFGEDEYATLSEIRLTVLRTKNPRTVLKAKSRLFHKLMEEFGEDEYVNVYTVRTAINGRGEARKVLETKGKVYKKLKEKYINDEYITPGIIRGVIARSSMPEATLIKQRNLYLKLLKEFGEDEYVERSVVSKLVFNEDNPREALLSRIKTYHELVREFAGHEFATKSVIRSIVTSSDNPREALLSRIKTYHELVREFAGHEFIFPYMIKDTVLKAENPRKTLLDMHKLYISILDQYPDLSIGAANLLARRNFKSSKNEFEQQKDKLLERVEIQVLLAKEFAAKYGIKSLSMACWLLDKGTGDEDSMRIFFEYLQIKGIRSPLSIDRPFKVDSTRTMHDTLAESDPDIESAIKAREQITSLVVDAGLSENELEFLMLMIVEQDQEAASQVLEIKVDEAPGILEQLLSKLRNTSKD